MLRWLILLGVTLYGALLIGGEDRGQLRAGLREQPATTPRVQAADPHQGMDQPVLAPIAIIGPVAASLTKQDLPAVETAEAADVDPPKPQLRWVSVDRANVRSGPSRSSAIAGRVEGGEAVLVLWIEEPDWARIRVEGDGVDGFMHTSLLTDIDPQSHQSAP